MIFMKRLLILFTFLLMSTLIEADEANNVAGTLDALHVAASHAESKAYFDLFTEDAVFIGTDVNEYWTINEFKDFAEPYFSKGKGWTYVPRSRNITFSESGKMAWFHEILDNASYGTTRGTGVLILEEDNVWRIAQYHLTIPIPNELAGELTTQIKAKEAELADSTKHAE